MQLISNDKLIREGTIQILKHCISQSQLKQAQ